MRHQEPFTADPNLTYSSIVSVALTLHRAFSALGYRVEMPECEELSLFLNSVYGTRNRAFHDIQHALEVSEGASPLGQIAALFHDVVYIQVDRSRLPALRKQFGPFDPRESLELTIPSLSALEKWGRATCALFGKSSGQKVSITSGINEFLSAWVCVQTLKNRVSEKHLLEICLAIRCTIPFQADRANPTFLDEVMDQFTQAASLLGLVFSEKDRREALKQGVLVSNNDIKGFGLEEPEVFIYNSWALLFENNPSLQNTHYTIRSYRDPLQRLEGFLASMTPKRIFLQYDGYPDDRRYRNLISGAEANLRIGRDYVRIKLLETLLLEAFSQATGADCPLELFTGPKPRSREMKTARIGAFLNQYQFPWNMDGKDEKVLRLLSEGRAYRSKFDTKTSEFASFLYVVLSKATLETLYETSQRFARNEIKAEDFLKDLPPAVLIYVARALSKVALTRSDRILALAESLCDSTASAA
jgi:hypothetical protein